MIRSSFLSTPRPAVDAPRRGGVARALVVVATALCALSLAPPAGAQVPASSAASAPVSSAPASSAAASATAPTTSPPASQNDAATIDARIDAVLGDHAAYAAAFRAFQSAVERHDARAAAALVAYPIEVQLRGRKTRIRSAAAFVARYDAIVTPEIARAVTEQRYESLMVSQQGVMLGNGQVWLNGVCTDRSCQKFTPKVVTIQGSR